MCEDVYISTENIRLDAFLKLSAACVTGGEAKMRILAGEVMVDGAICITRGLKLIPGRIITVESREYRVMAK